MKRSNQHARRDKAIAHFVGAALLTLCVSSSVGGEQNAPSVHAEKGSTKIMTGLPLPGKGPATDTPNPFLSWLPAEATPDIRPWQVRSHEIAADRRQAALAVSGYSKPGAPTALIPVAEAEGAGTLGLNDAQGSAEFIAGFGTGTGDDGAADVSGEFAPESTPVVAPADAEDEGDINLATSIPIASRERTISAGLIGDGPHANKDVTVIAGPGPSVEDDGDVAKASDSTVAIGEQVTIAGTIGDGPFGSGTMTPSGDFDFYTFTIFESQTTFIEVNATGGSALDPIVALWGPPNPGYDLITLNDDAGFGTTDSQIIINLSCTPEPGCYPQTFYIGVGGFVSFPTGPGSFPSDVTDSSTGPGAGSEGDYELVVTMPEFAPGDFDFYGVPALTGDLITIDVDTDSYVDGLDPILAVYSSSGTVIALNDDDFTSPSFTLDSYISFYAPADDTYYVAVGGFNPFAFPLSPFSFLANPFDSSTGPGPGVGSEGSYDLIVSRNDVDIDFYSFDLEAGDIIATNLLTSSADHGPTVSIGDPSGGLLKASASDHAGSLPGASTLPGGGAASSAYIVSEAGRHTVGVGFGDGVYTLELRALRPPQEATGTKQRLFIDFDGATVDTGKFGSSIPSENQPVALSPLSSFLGAWGLSGADEDAVIDAVLAAVEENLLTDIQGTGENLTFDIEILNSRDHADPFGDPDVSRVIVGGTRAESGVETIGIAQSIDIGNFDLSEDSLVLLDLLSAPAGDPNSLNSFGLTGGATKIDLVGLGVGNITAHEAGHFFANYHTDNGNSTPNIMDTGGNLGNLVGIGLDGILGSGDDVDVDFGKDSYEPSEGFAGTEDTKNSIAFGLTTGPADFVDNDVTAIADVTGDTVPDVAVFPGDDSTRPKVYVYSGVDGSLDSTISYLNDGWRGVAVSTVQDADQNGTADDPAVAVLAVNRTTGKIRVETRRVDTGAFISSIQFFNENWRVVDVVAVDDPNGDGNTSDTAIAVLTERFSDGRIQLQLRDLNSGALISNVVYLNARWTPIAAAVADRSAVAPAGTLAPLIGVIAENAGNGKRTMQARVAGSGVFDQNIKFLGSTWDYLDVSVNHDTDGDGTNDDPVWLVLAKRASDDVIRVQSKFVSDGSFDSNIVILSAAWQAFRLDTALDISGNSSQEMVITARRRSDNVERVHVKDYATRSTTINISP